MDEINKENAAENDSVAGNTAETAVEAQPETAAAEEENIFAEKNFALPPQQNMNVPYVNNMNPQYSGMPVQNSTQPGAAPQNPMHYGYYNTPDTGYYAPAQNISPNEQYRYMYAGQNNSQPNSIPQGQIPPVSQPQVSQPPVSQPCGGYYASQYGPDIIPPVSPVPEKGASKGAKIAVGITAAVIALILIGVIIALAVSHKDNEKISAGNSGNAPSVSEDQIVVNIQTEAKPVEGDQYYQNKETGLLTTAGVAKQILPSVVNLYGYQDTVITHYSSATGIIISEDGYIVTNAHMVDDIKRIKAKLYDGREFEAKIIGYDSKTDLAVIKIEADNLTPAVIGDPTQLLQGEQVVAVGNADGYNDSVTVGYVSHLNRKIGSYTGYPISCIQTDAALNTGNSGGALVNMYGQVVGIVTSKSAEDGVENIGFAIRTDFAVPLIEDLIKQGYITGRPRIGILYKHIDPASAEAYGVKPGLLVAEVASDCDIANTELKPDDIITELDGIPMITSDSVLEFQTTHKAGQTVKAKIYRKDITGEVSEFEISFKLEQDGQK